MTIVGIARGTDIAARTVRAIELVGGISAYVSPGDVVAVKPNLIYPSPPPVTTHPIATATVVRLCMEAGASKVIVVEGGAPVPKRQDKFSERDVFERTGTREAVEAAGGEIVCLDELPSRLVKVPNGVLYREMGLYDCILEADKIISVPVMKTQYDTDVSLGIKNFHGAVADADKFWKFHKDDISQKLVDIMKVMKPCLTVIDATKGMEGQGPIAGTSVDMDLTIAGSDVVATDAVGAYIMGINEPLDVDHIRIAAHQGIGIGRLDKIRIVGESADAVRKTFKMPQLKLTAIHDNVTVIEGCVCRACRARARWALDEKKALGDFDGEHTTILIGHEVFVPDPDDIKGKIYVVGDCACYTARSLMRAPEGKVVYVRGCPPIPVPDMVNKYREPSKPCGGCGG